ncbi:MAG: GGDEF domain-containing protein [Lachnospiraceae bacterium]|nr:GGDEF domain-containing protein [Lachnospiraceae bacterium]
MDYKKLLEDYNCKACVMSVETYSDGTYGNILVVDGNKLYKDDIEDFTGRPFVENTPYYMSFPKDLNFEDFIYRSAVLHQNLHTYVNLYQIGLWVELYLLPLTSDKENMGYCLYSYIVTPKVDTGSMSDISPTTSSAVLKTCIKLRGAEDFENKINEVTADIRDICDACRCCILTIDNDEETCKVLGDAYMPGFPSFLTTEDIRKEFYKLILTWEDTLAGSTCFIVKNEQDMNVIKERNPEWYESLSKYRVESMVLFPLKYNGTLLGYIWATNFDIRNTVKIKEVLELTTYFIASEIANYRMLKRMEVLGTIDIMTGSLNRNAMNNRVAQFDTQKDESIKSIGILFADLNGLKMINDSSGHLEGDRFLKKASAVLRQVFVDDEIYRAGGDEFMVLAINNTQEEFDEKMRRIREIAEKQTKVNFAIGSCFEEGDIDIRRALRKADEDMYEDKKEYYSRHPGLKYR